MITVVVPIYNMEKYLNKCLDSLINQSYKDYELILVDDCSADNCFEICKSFQETHKDKRIKVISHEENGGLSVARNSGIKEAKGEFIIFPDPDDYVEPDYLYELIHLNDEFKADLEICNFNRFSKNQYFEPACALKTKILNQEEAMLKSLDNHNSFGCFAWNKLYHMDIIRKNNLLFEPDAKSAQDTLFFFEYIKYCQKISFTDKVLYHYNKDSGVWSDTSGISPRKLTILSVVYPKLLNLDIVKDNGNLEKEIKANIAGKCLDFLYMCHCSNTKDAKLIKLLKNNVSAYKKEFFRSKTLKRGKKIAGGIYFLSENLYYFVYKIRKKYKPI